MLARQIRTTQGVMLKTCLLLLGGLAVVCYSAYAVYAAGGREDSKPLAPAPSITGKPVKHSMNAWARFSFKDHQHGVRFACSLDGSKYKTCRSPKRYPGPLTEGRHTFHVRATRKGKSSRPASYTWLVEKNVEPQVSGESFSISLGVIRPLYPGAGPVAIPLTLSNPNDTPIYVTSLTVVATSSSAACNSSSNVSITQSSASSAAPVLIGANGSVTLPAQGVAAPTIQLLDLPVNQDACMNAAFPLSFTGSAHS